MLRKIRYLYILLILSGVMSASSNVLCQAKQIVIDPTIQDYPKWDSLPFDAKANIPYQQIKQQIDGMVARGTLTAGVIDANQKAFLADTSDPLKVYQFAYSLYAGQKLPVPIKPQDIQQDGEFLAAPTPDSIDYIEMRFIANAQSTSPPQLIPLGKRLLAAKPEDYDIEFYIVKCLPVWRSATYKSSALKIVHHMITQQPHRLSAWESLANVYDVSWFVHHDTEDRKLAIEYYKKCLHMMSRKNFLYARTVQFLRYIENWPNGE